MQITQRSGQPDRITIIVASRQWAEAYCAIDPVLNPRDKDVFIISSWLDLNQLKGRHFDETPLIIDGTAVLGLHRKTVEQVMLRVRRPNS